MGTVTSTMDIARTLIRHGANEGATVIAAHQSQGRGRAGRTWDSPASTGLYCSIILRPHIPAADFQPMSIAVGLALCDALDPGHRNNLELKWPNDILVQGRKLAGILIATDLYGPVVESAILGIGINLLPDPAQPSLAISLAELSNRSAIPASDLFPAIAAALRARYSAILDGNPERALQGWSDRLAYRNQLVTIEDGPHRLTGILLGIDSAGSLHLQTPSGPKLITSGDLNRGPQPS
ncbi:MAG TPA: biotin--[acetyl-CoA-carboxylase] ligase [Thermomicrobiales bacterium]|nr:biotin--[acetyl-CoA-carboxylase] ligase [Thermomicrobiales bacterium]